MTVSTKIPNDNDINESTCQQIVSIRSNADINQIFRVITFD